MSEPPLTASDTAPAALVLYGGTFDPIHRAHVAVARALSRQLGGLPVTLLPNYQSPLKDHPRAGDQRLALIRLAICDYPELRVDTLELDRPQLSYTVDTLRHFRTRFPDTPLIWLLGADSYQSLDRWHRWQELPTLCHLAIAPRPGVAADTPCAAQGIFAAAEAPALLRQPAGLRFHMARPRLDVSASAIRAALKERGSCPALAPSVLTYIQQHGLYGCRTST